jgi:hypothetical protein
MGLKLKGLLVAGLATIGLSAPAFADTLQTLTTRGGKMEMQGQTMVITFTPDGKYTTDQGGEGTWRIDGNKLCWSAPGITENQCDVYPAGKGSGDTFELTNEVLGTFKVTIN